MNLTNTLVVYSELIKPSWAPPPIVFIVVWTFLYILIAISFTYVYIMFQRKQLMDYVTLPFVLNLFFNLIFTYLQFTLKNNVLASIDVVLVLLTTIWLMVSIYPYKKWVAYMQIPYLLWVSLATVLQLTITYLNWK